MTFEDARRVVVGLSYGHSTRVEDIVAVQSQCQLSREFKLALSIACKLSYPALDHMLQSRIVSYQAEKHLRENGIRP